MTLPHTIRFALALTALVLPVTVIAQTPQGDPAAPQQALPQDVLEQLLHRPATKPLAELVAPDRLTAARRLDGPLAQLAAAALTAPLAPLDVREFRIDARVRYGTVYFVRDNAPVVDITVIGDAAQAEADLRALPGVEISAVASTESFTLISAVVPVARLLDAAAVTDVRALTASGAANGQGFLADDPDAQKSPEEIARAAEPLSAWPNDWMNDAWVPDEEAELLALIDGDAPAPRSQGAANNQAEQMLDIDQARLVYGANAVDGTGIDVGTLSDSANRRDSVAGGPVGIGESQATGDLPPNPQILILLDNSTSTTDEGRAMMEHIFDIVPAVARLGFSTAFGGEAVFANGITNLGANGMDIINDDVVYFAEPYYQDGVVAQAVITYVNGGGIYFALNHNYGDLSREDLWSDTDADNFHNYAGGGAELVNFTIAANATANFGLQWSQPWGSATTDLRLEIWTTDGATLLASSTEDNDVTGIPRDSINFNNALGAPRTLGLAVRRIDGSAAGLTIKYICFDNGVNNVTFDTSAALAAGTLTPHAGVAQSIAVGAAPYFNRSTIEPYSGRGPHRRFFNSAGGASPALYTKPDITGVDGCNTTFFPNFLPANDTEPDGFPNFFGTSAATPNVAAIGAMMLEIAGGPGSLTQNNVRDILAVTAVDLGTAGHDRVWGYGRAQALGAVAAARGREVTEYALYPNQFGQDSLVGNLFGVTDRDTVIYSSDSSGNVTVSVTESHATMDPMVLVHNETSRVPVGCDYDSGVGDDALLTHPGSFWVVYAAKVLSQTDFTTPPPGDFTISIDGPDVGTIAFPINAATWSGTLNGVLDDNGDLDYYSVTVPPAIPTNLRRMIVTSTPVAHDGRVDVYDAAGNRLAFGDGIGSDVPDVVTIQNVSPGQTFIISVKSWVYSAAGNFTLQIQFAPDNDLCADATAMPVGSTRFGATDAATFDAAPFCGTSNTAPGVWYRFTGTGRTITVTTCNPGTDYDTKVSVYCNDCGVLTCVGGNDDQLGPFDPACDVTGIGANRGSTVSFCSQAGAQYLILVHGFSAAVGDFELSVFSDGPPCTGAAACGGEPIGACCAPTDCTGSGTCESGLVPRCGGSFLCLCFDSADGDVVCFDGSVSCGSLVPCPGGSADCPGGQVCITDTTCCGTPVCVPPCPTAPDFGRSLNEAMLSGDDPILAALDPEFFELWRNQTRGLTGGCFETTQETCEFAGGSYAGDGVACDGFACCEDPDVPHDPAPPDGAANVDPDDTVLRWNPDAGQLYGIDSDADRFLAYNPLTGSAGFLGSTASGPSTPAGLAWTGTTMYTIDLAASGALYSLNLITGLPQFVANTGLTGWQGLAADPTDDGRLYGIKDVVNSLYRIDLDGTATLIAPAVNLGGPGLIAALTFDGMGRLWAISFANGSIGIIDKNTGAVLTVVTVTPLLSVQGLDFDSAGNLWAQSAVTDTLYTINLLTGVATPVGPDGTLFVKGLAFAGYPGVPLLPDPLPAPVIQLGGDTPMDDFAIPPDAGDDFDPATVLAASAHTSLLMHRPAVVPDLPPGYRVRGGMLLLESEAAPLPEPAASSAPRGFYPGLIRIDFDDDAAPCFFAGTTRLTTAYAPLGVVFEGPGGNDGGAILDECSKFSVAGHSPPNFLAFNSGSALSDGGIPRDPETIHFGQPMNYVSLRAGTGLNPGQPLTLTGYNARGLIVESASITLAPNLQNVTITGPGIVRAVIDTPTAAFVVDDLAVAPCTEYYQVLLDTVNPPANIACALTATPFCDSGPLLPFTTYYWQALVVNCCDFNAGPVWTFSTGSGCPGSGDCCEAHNGDVGCEDPECCERVCTIDPYCCTTAWDGLCADEAADLCAVCGAGCACADFTGDNLVNLVDFVTFQVCFGAVGPNVDCPPDVFACGDLNADGIINLVDFVTFQTIFFLTPDGITPPDCLSID